MDRNDHAVGARWETGLAELILACPQACSGDEASLLRQGYATILDAAAFDPALAEDMPGTAAFEAMLVCAPESAALALIPSRAGYMLSRGEGSIHICSIFMPECGEHTAECGTAGLAILAATLSTCCALLGRHGDRGLLLN
ncbi:MAG: hypothetical protein ACTHLU_02105 [Novosphingobium sp.]